MAKRTGQGAADLRGDAQRATVFLRDVDRLDLLAIREAQQPLAGPVDRGEQAGYTWPAQLVARSQLVAKRLRQRRHRREIGDAAMIDPVPELARAKRFGPKRRQFGDESLAAKPDEVTAPGFQNGGRRHGLLDMA